MTTTPTVDASSAPLLSSSTSSNEATITARPMGRRRVVIALIAAAVVTVGLWLAYRPSADQVQGMADADDINVAAKISARVSALHVHEGEGVVPGQLLFELVSPEVEAKRRQAAAVLAAARAQLSKTREGTREEEIRAALANWNRAVAANALAQSTARRIATLVGEGVVTRQRDDEAQAQARSAIETEAAARAQYDQATSGARVQDRDAAAAQVRQAEGAVAEVEAAYDEVSGRAPVAGEIEKRLADVGELVPAGYPVFTLVDLRTVWVALYLREDQIRRVRIGSTLSGDVPALGLKRIPFRVYYINPAGDFATWRATRQSDGYDVKSFEVRVRPATAIDGFRPGMSVLFPWPQQ